ncbi:MAG: tetratricopeptide repeat protein [Thermoanaerobaculia bacterium]
MEQSTDWIPALVVLALGVLIGVVVYWRSSRREAAPAPSEVALEARDQRARFDALIQQLRELDDLASKRTAAQLAQERRALETEAALALRELAAAAPESYAPAAGTAPAEHPEELPAGRRSMLPGFLWGAGTVLAVSLLVFFVTRGAFDRAPGGSLTGGSMSPAPATGAGPMIDLTGLREAVVRNPEDMEARLDLAQALLINQDIAGVAEQTRYVLSRNPGHPRALSYGSLVELASGNLDTALEMAERSIEGDPENPETWVHLALIHAQRGSAAETEATMREAIGRFPGDAPTLESILTELVPSSAAGSPGVVSGSSVRIDLEAPRPGGGTVFVFVYPGSSDEPVAVRRESIQSFPARLNLGTADLMTGTALPDEMRIEARLDGDGLARTREPGDLEGNAMGVRPDSSVTIRLESVNQIP